MDMTIWKNLHQALQKHSIKQDISKSIHDILAYGLSFVCHDTITYHPSFHTIELQQLYHDQSFGMATVIWALPEHGQAFVIACIQPQLNGTPFYAHHCLMLIWQAILQI